jgi:hypothetical protein
LTLAKHTALTLVASVLAVPVPCTPAVQGLFLKRQQQVAVEMSALSCDYYLKGRFMWEEILTGSKSESFYGLLDRVTDR